MEKLRRKKHRYLGDFKRPFRSFFPTKVYYQNSSFTYQKKKYTIKTTLTDNPGKMNLLQMTYTLNHIKMTPTYCSITSPSLPAEIGTWNEKVRSSN